MAIDPQKEYTSDFKALTAETGALAFLTYGLDTAAGFRNEAVPLTPAGQFLPVYGKIHPGPGEPKAIYSDVYPVYDTPWGRLATVICMDSNFTDVTRRLAQLGAQLIAVPTRETQVWEHLQRSPGKRLRPTLLLLVARAHGEPDARSVMGGAVVEMIHTATLIHDDVVDKATLRRGQPAVNHRWHDGIALMMGDFLYSKAFQLFTAAGLGREMALLAETTNRMSVAEMMQFQYHANLDMREDEYMLLIREKTAALIAASCALGALFSGAHDPAPNHAYGNDVGHSQPRGHRHRL